MAKPKRNESLYSKSEIKNKRFDIKVTKGYFSFSRRNGNNK